MNFLVGLLVVTLVIDASIAVPVHDPSDDAEFIDVQEQRPRSRFGPRGNDDDDVEPAFRDFKGVVDTGVGYPFLQPMPHPLSFNLGFFDSFEDILRRLRTNFWPIDIPDAGSDAQDDFSLRIDPSKGGNTTSVVKVVDGHKIEINDTVYSNADKSGGAVFKFRIINIRPVDDSSEETETTTLDTAAATASTTASNTIRNPITSAPKNPTNNKSDEDADINKSDERKEEIEDNKPLNNEILGNVDDPEVISTTEVVIDLNAPERLSLDPAALNKDTMASADDTASPTPIVVGIETEELTDYGTEASAAEGAAAATTQTTPSKVQVDKEFYGNIASSVFKSEKFVINSDNVNSSDSGKNTTQTVVETETATSMTANDSVHDADDDDDGDGGDENDDDDDDDDDDDSVEEEEKLQSKTDNFNESISVEIQNQQTKMEQNQQLKAESEVVEQQQQHLASNLKLTMEVGEKSKDQPESNESLSMQQQQQQEEEAEEQLTPNRSSNTDSQREDINSSSSDDDDDNDDDHDDDVTSTSIDHEKYQKFNNEWASLAEDVAAIENENNDLNNDIDVYDNVPAIDLSNDIAINDLLAAHNAPQNADVEVFSVDEFQSRVPATSLSSSSMWRRQGRTNADGYQRRTLSDGLSSSLNIK